MRYRKELEKLIDVKDIIVVAKVSKRSAKKHVSPYGNTYYVETMLLEDVKCCIRKGNKLYVQVKLDHIWLSADQSKVVNNFKIKPGHEVRFYADVIQYEYSNGTKQLGLVDNNRIKASFK